ncbi:MAG: hypothetical protein ABI947_25855 [Chloroflexota bacterium]
MQPALSSKLLSELSCQRVLDGLFAILLSHAHTDHVGLLPQLSSDPEFTFIRLAKGTKPKIGLMASPATKDLTSVMLQDATYNLENQPQLSFTQADVTSIVNAIDDFLVTGNLSALEDLGHVKTFNAGHILGSRMILIEYHGIYIGSCH